jgi:urease accessory protein
MQTLDEDWLAWQVVDSAFPTGAFAHSYGLESSWQHGEVEDVVALRRVVRAVILQNALGVLPLANDAYDDPSRLARLDAIADAFLLNTVANRASRAQGRTLMATAHRIWPSAPLDALRAAAAASPAHVAPVSGAVFRLLGLSRRTAQRVLVFSGARAVLSAAVRLGIAGSYEAQRLQSDCAPVLDQVLRRCESLGVEDLAQPAPDLDLLQAAHDRLYSRLFQS